MFSATSPILLQIIHYAHGGSALGVGDAGVISAMSLAWSASALNVGDHF